MEKSLCDGVAWSFYNEYGDLVEVDVFYFSNCIKVSALLCEDDKDFTGEGDHRSSRKVAIKRQLQI